MGSDGTAATDGIGQLATTELATQLRLDNAAIRTRISDLRAREGKPEDDEQMEEVIDDAREERRMELEQQRNQSASSTHARASRDARNREDNDADNQSEREERKDSAGKASAGQFFFLY